MQKKGKSKYIPTLFSFVDVILLSFSFFIAKSFLLDLEHTCTLFCDVLIVSSALLWVVFSLKFDLYEIPRVYFMHKILSKNIYVLFYFTMVCGGLIFFLTDFKFPRSFFAYSILLFSLFMLSWRLTSFYLLRYFRKKGQNPSKVVLVGLNRNMSKLIDRVYLRPRHGFQISGLFTDAKVKNRLEQYYKGGLSDIVSFLDSNPVDEIIISLPHHQGELINKLFKYADNNMIRVRVIPEFSEYLSQTFSINYVYNIPILKLRSEPLASISNIIAKRVFDLIFSLFIIVFIFSWLFPIIAVIIKLTSKGPVFFIQERTGQDGKTFKCLKFRSMTINNGCDSVQATKDDARVTKFGAFMRKTSIDELPQIINVLLNHMSLVGPRPHMLKHTEEYRVLVDKFMVRHFAKPGVTGWAQINGYRGETKKVRDMKNRAAADIWYIENWSFLLDLRIVFSTAWSMFFNRDKNAY